MRVLLRDTNVQAAAQGERIVLPASALSIPESLHRTDRRLVCAGRALSVLGGHLPPLDPLRLNPHSWPSCRLQTPGAPPPLSRDDSSAPVRFCPGRQPDWPTVPNPCTPPPGLNSSAHSQQRPHTGGRRRETRPRAVMGAGVQSWRLERRGGRYGTRARRAARRLRYHAHQRLHAPRKPGTSRKRDGPAATSARVHLRLASGRSCFPSPTGWHGPGARGRRAGAGPGPAQAPPGGRVCGPPLLSARPRGSQAPGSQARGPDRAERRPGRSPPRGQRLKHSPAFSHQSHPSLRGFLTS